MESNDFASSGRLPLLPTERIFTSAGSFARSCVTFGSAIWVFLVGSALPTVGSTRLGVAGYAIGLVVGFVPVALASGVPSFRHGIETVDFSKSVFGTRGALLPLLGILITALAWASVVMAMVARGCAKLLAPASGSSDGVISEPVVVAVGLLSVFLCWLLVRAGPRLIQRVNDWIGPMLVLLAIVCLVILARRFGATHLLDTDVSPDKALTTDRLKSLAYAIELGVSTSLAWWPFLGGLFRLVGNRRAVFTPSMWGLTIVGGAFCSGVAALAAAATGTGDPITWIRQLAGNFAGSVICWLILGANIPTMALLVYFAGTSIQQFRSLARIPWGLLCGILLLVPATAAFFTSGVLAHVLNVTALIGLQFVAITGIGLVDYYILRRESLSLDQCFVKTRAGTFWFWGGVNWVAIGIVAAGVVAYFMLYDPVSMTAVYAFRWAGASIPVMIGSGILYWVCMTLWVIPRGLGGYSARGSHVRDERVVVSL